KLSPQKSKKFQPSGAAIHPKLQKLFILSGVSRQLAITDLSGNVEGVYMLAPRMFPQAEGITFKANGDMYISNEGGKGRATLLRFIYTETNNPPDTSRKKLSEYDFEKPDDKMELGKHLHEIS